MRILTKKVAKLNPARTAYAFWLQHIAHNRWLDTNFNPDCRSRRPLDIVIPVTTKDSVLLPLVIESVKTFVRHPLNRLYIVSPQPDAVRPLVDFPRVSCFRDEEVLDRPEEFYRYDFHGLDRSGWMQQQMIKLSGESFCESDDYLVVDADTVFVRPQVFHHKGRYTLNVARYYHQPYYRLITRLFGYKTISTLSFISHHMIFSRDYLRRMKNDIRAHTGLPWDEAIMQHMRHDTISPFSEYETYGNYMFNRYPDKIRRHYYHGRDIVRQEPLMSVEGLSDYRRQGLKSVSFHSYMNPVKPGAGQ